LALSVVDVTLPVGSHFHFSAIITVRKTPLDFSTGVLLLGYKDSNLEMTGKSPLLHAHFVAILYDFQRAFCCD
jgi:hypothetical protein